jgi:Raf kinase inhibitor-like YbhB/YbcL family protein
MRFKMSYMKLGTLSISSNAFEQHGKIPRQYTGEGDNKSPPLAWKGVPDGTKQLALVCHDPDAPMPNGFTHWVIYGIPLTESGLPEGGGASFVQGLNGIGKPGYIGPAPPPGHGVHHYYFWLYAVGDGPELKPNLNRDGLLGAIANRVVGQARLVGTYEK